MFFSFKFISLVAFAVSVADAQATPGSPVCARNYTVRLGDICDSISAANHASTFQIAHVNAGKIDPLCDDLFQGEVICLGFVGQDCNITTVVQNGDSCPSIATAAGTTTSILLQNNPNVDANCDNIYVGEVLCTANQVFVTN